MRRDVLLGLDIGGSSVKFVLVDSAHTDGAVADNRHRPALVRHGQLSTPVADIEESMMRVAQDAVGADRLVGVGVTIPGLVDEARGVVLRSTNVPLLEGVDLAGALSSSLGVDTRLVNDGKAAALAEAWWGAGRAQSDVFSLVLGTGVAGAHVVDGEAVLGAHGAAGELGHTGVDPDGELCSCGRRGCLETVIGANGLARAWRRAGGSGSAQDLLAAYEAGVSQAVPIVTSACSALAEAILSLVAIVDPGCIVIGGGLASEPHRLVTASAAVVAERATFHRVPPIVPAELAVWAGAWGAIHAACQYEWGRASTSRTRVSS